MSSINDYIQDVFQIVVNKDDQQTDGPSDQVIYVPFDISTAGTDDILDEHLEAILFERLLMSNEDLNVNKLRIKKKPNRISHLDEELFETNPLIYLYLCFQRVHSVQFDKNELKIRFKNIILNQANRYLCNIYPNLERKPLLVELLDRCYFIADDNLLKAFITVLGQDDECDLDTLVDILQDVYYNELCGRLSKMEFSDPNLFKTINYIRLLTSNSRLSLAFIKLNSPWYKVKDGRNFNFDFTDFSSNSFVLKTLIGHLLSISTLPKFNQPNFKYFNEAMNNTPDVTANLEKNIGSQIYRIVAEVQKIFLEMLKQGKDVKEETLNYICLVLYCFKNRSQMWVNQFPTFVQLTDGFMLNFLHVLLLLCKPFAIAHSSKLLKIDPTYCAIPALPLKDINSREFEKIHLRGLDQDTYLIGKKDSEQSTVTSEQDKSSKNDDLIELKDSLNYNFMTEIFFACHKAIQLAFKPCYDRFLSTASNLNELSRASVSGRIPNQEMFNTEMNNQLSKFYSTKAIICQDDFLELFVNFSLASATWLSNLAMYSDILDEKKQNFSPITEFYPFNLKVDLNLEVNSSSSFKLLQYIPEFVCESVTESLIFVQKFANDNQLVSRINFEPLLTFILSFIASPHKMKNPHLRAKLAEVLEELIPKTSHPQYQINAFELNRDLYKKFEHKQYLIPCLIHVYVSIELTGQSVAFEQKFQYRRSIYEVIQYLWNEPSVCSFYRQSMKELSNEAINQIENPKQPLFLRFINLMTNDATFVLDESLDHLSKLKQLQNEKDGGQWKNLTFNERREKDQSLAMTERMCKWSNFNSKMMVTMLYYLTTEIKDIFCHEIYVERLAQMLNYFLERLVGPNRKDYKVKSTKDVLFNPGEIVFNICRIYLNLGHPENNRKFYEKFCLAIINDSRSYSDKLLQLAIDVLWKTKGQEVVLIEKLAEVDKFNKELIEKVKKEEIDVKDIPEEFLDPILGTLLQNPVKLPSGYILDKSTIARHLLSDQTDPFTRKPLTLEMLVPEVELKSRIDSFVKEYFKKKEQQESSSETATENESNKETVNETNDEERDNIMQEEKADSDFEMKCD